MTPCQVYNPRAKEWAPVVLVAAMMLAGRFNLGRINPDWVTNSGPHFAFVLGVVGIIWFGLSRPRTIPCAWAFLAIVLFHMALSMSQHWSVGTPYTHDVSDDTFMLVWVLFPSFYLIKGRITGLLAVLVIIAVIYAIAGVFSGMFAERFGGGKL